MTMSFYFFLPYLLSFFFFFNLNSPFMFWVSTEFNLVLFILFLVSFMENTYKQEMHDMVLFYFFVQLFCSMLILLNFFFDQDGLNMNSLNLFILALVTKLGIFPSFYWVFKIIPFLGKANCWFLLTLQKVPFFFVLFNCSNSFIPLFLLFSFISGSVLIFFSHSILFMLVSSSIMMTFWIFYLNFLGCWVLLSFIFFYSWNLFLFLKAFSISNGKFLGMKSLFPFMFFIGLPPLSLFFFKLELLKFFLLSFGKMEVIFFWLATLFSLFGYMKFSFKFFFKDLSGYGTNISCFETSLYFFLSFFYFFVYLVFQGKLFKLSSSYLE